MAPRVDWTIRQSGFMVMSAGSLTRLDGSRCNLTTLTISTMEILRIETVGHTRHVGFHKVFLLDTRFRGQEENVSTGLEYRSLHRGHGGMRRQIN